jgi:hypothetical protein
MRASIIATAAAAVTPADASSSPVAPTAVAPTAATAEASTPAPKPEDGIEIAPEPGATVESGPVKLRFKGADGQYTNTPPIPADQKIEIEIGGKRYVKDLAGIARMAADAVVGQRHATENSHIKTQIIPQYEQHIESVEEMLQAQIALNREILSDEGIYAARRQEFAELNSPERRAERAERALADERDRNAADEQGRAHTEYYQSNVLPEMHAILSECSSLTNEEILGRIALHTGDLLEGGVVPPKNYPKFASYLREQLAPWARAEHAKRGQADTARREAEQRAEEERRRAAQLTTRTELGAALVPAGAPAAAAPVASITPTPQAPARSRAEARERVRAAMTAGMQ